MRSNGGRCLVIVTLMGGFVTQPLALPLHLMLEDHTWGASAHRTIESAEDDQPQAYQPRGLALDRRDHRHHEHPHYHSTPHEKSGADTGSGESHPPHPGEDHFGRDEAPAPAILDSSQPRPSLVAILPSTTAPSLVRSVCWFTDEPPRQAPTLKPPRLPSPRAPPIIPRRFGTPFLSCPRTPSYWCV